MKRRDFIAGLGGFAAWAGPSRGQQSRGIPLIGVLWHAGNAEEEREYFSVLINEFARLGCVEGKNVAFLHKFPAEDPARFRSLANRRLPRWSAMACRVSS
jgi:putative ABC transport system substrate-binding protein